MTIICFSIITYGIYTPHHFNSGYVRILELLITFTFSFVLLCLTNLISEQISLYSKSLILKMNRNFNTNKMEVEQMKTHENSKSQEF